MASEARPYRTTEAADQAAPSLVRDHNTPLYVYDLEVVRQRARKLKNAFAYRSVDFLYAIKANSCPMVARVLVQEGFGVDAVSPGEVELALRLGVPPNHILYTENSMNDAEMEMAVKQMDAFLRRFSGVPEQGVLINCGSLDRLERLGAAGAKTASVRVNPDIGASHHPHTLTAGPLTKFGIHYSKMRDIAEAEQKTGIKVVGIHMHIGSGSLDSTAFVEAMKVILSAAIQLKNIEFINFGGGIGVPYQSQQVPMDINDLGRRLSQLMVEFSAEIGRSIELKLEPGRFLVAECGSLYTRVTSVKEYPAVEGVSAARIFVGTDTGFNHMIRPCLYGSYHPVRNITNAYGAGTMVDVVGNICESGDVFARDRIVPEARVGDLLAIGMTGAYGFSMASAYNTRPLPAEVVIDGTQAPRLARKRQTVDDLLSQWEWS